MSKLFALKRNGGLEPDMVVALALATDADAARRTYFAETSGVRFDETMGLAAQDVSEVRWLGGNFWDVLHAVERQMIRQALLANNLKIAKAAAALGFMNHNSLLSLLNSRHHDLREELNIQPRPRRKSLGLRPRKEAA